MYKKNDEKHKCDDSYFSPDNIDLYNKNLNSSKNRYTYSNKKQFQVYFLSDLLESKNSSNNRDINKIKKSLLPLLTYIVENKDFNKKNKNITNDISVILKNIFKNLPLEFKEKIIDMNDISPIEESIRLNKKIDEAIDDALVFLRDFRNIMMHKRVKQNTFEISSKFKNYNGALFNIFNVFLKKELDKNINTIKENYIKKILEHNISDTSNIPLIYSLMTLSLFTEKQYIKEVLDLLKFPRFIEYIILKFSVRGGYKTYIPGLPINTKNDKLYLKQLYNEEINTQVNSSGRRIIKTLKDFDMEETKQDNDTKIFNSYQQAIRLYGYRGSFPKISILEDSIKTYKAKELISNEEKKIEELKKNAKLIKNPYEKTKKEKEIINREKNKKSIEEIKSRFTNVFRNNDVFMREVLEYLNNKYSNFFGSRTWSIVGNAVIWMMPNKKVMFDVRKKVSPSNNAMNSLYKIMYNQNNADKYSLNRYNLRALITSLLIRDKGFDISTLREYAGNSKVNTAKKISNTDYDLQKDIKGKIENWDRYALVSFVIKVVRKFIFKNIYIHNRDSVSFHRRMKNLLYKLDNGAENIYIDAIDLIKRYGVLEKDIDENIKRILSIDNLKDMALASSKFVGMLKNERKKSNADKYTFKTWSKFAFLPCNTKNKEIYSILDWDNIKSNYINKDDKDDVYQILYNYHKKNNMQLPTIIVLYEDYISKNNLKKFEEKEIRNILAEELIFSILSIQNLNYIFADKKNKYIILDKAAGGDNNNTILDFDIVYQLKHNIRINIKDYIRKDVKSALNWIFDDFRIKDTNESLEGTKEEILNKKLEAVISNYKFIRNNINLSKRAPKLGNLKIDYNNLDAEAIKHIVKTLRWVQKEFLFYICNIEVYLIYNIVNRLTTFEFNNLCKDGGYINFSDAVDKYNDIVEPIDKLIKVARNMICHSRVFDNQTKFEYKDIIPIVDNVYFKIFQKRYYDIKTNYRKYL